MSYDLHEAFSLDSFQDSLLFWEDFEGDSVKDLWTIANNATGTIAVVDAQDGGVARLNEPASADFSILNWNNIRSLHINKKLTFETRIKISADTSDRYLELYLYFDGDNYVLWRVPSSGTSNLLRCENDNTPTNANGSTISDTDYHIYRIECSSTAVHFYLDGVEEPNSPITANIPSDAGDYLQPRIYGLNINPGTGGGIYYDIDYIVIRQEI